MTTPAVPLLCPHAHSLLTARLVVVICRRYSAFYSFYALGASSTYCSIRVGTNHNASSAQLMGRCGQDLHSKHQKIYLDKGHRYYFEHQHRRAGTNTGLRAAVRIHAPAINKQWTKTKEEDQYHSWEEVQTVKFAPTFRPEEMELTITNVWGGSFRLHNNRNNRNSQPISLSAGPATAAAQLQSEIRRNHVMVQQHCAHYVVVTHLKGDPQKDGYIKFKLRYGCTPRSSGNEAHRYWSDRKVVMLTNDLISNKTSTTTTQTTSTTLNVTGGTIAR